MLISAKGVGKSEGSAAVRVNNSDGNTAGPV